MLTIAASKIDSLQHLDEVVIVTSSFKEVMPSQKIEGKQLEALNSYSVADAMRYFSGVQIKDYGGIGGLKTINIRSMGSQHVGVFYDGIQLGNAQNGVVDLGRFSLDDMDEISLYNGQKSQIFQPAKDFGSAGSIYLKTKNIRFDKGKTTNIYAKFKTGSIELINPSLRIEQKLSKNINASFSTEFLKSDGEYKFRLIKSGYDTTATRIGGDIKSFRAEATLNGTIQNGYWDAKIYSYFSDRGLPIAVENNTWAKLGQRLSDKTVFAQGSIFKHISQDYDTQLKFKLAYDYTHYVDTLTSVNTNNKYIQQEAYLSWVNKYSITTYWDLAITTDLQWNKLNSNMASFSYPQRLTSLSVLATSLDLNKVKLQASLLTTLVREKVKVNDNAPDKNEFTPAIFVGYRPFNETDFNIRGFYKRIFRMPTFNDLYYQQIGSLTLKPEYTNQYNLGLSYSKNLKNNTFKHFSVQADAYYNKVTNKILALFNQNMFVWSMQNLGQVEIRGIDVSANAETHINLLKFNIGINYTFQKAQDFSNSENSFYGDQIPYIPWHSGSFVLNTNYKSLYLNYSLAYVGKRYDINQNNISTNELASWYTHDLSVQKTFNIKTKYQIKASLEVNNLLDKQYDVVRNYPMPGRNFKLILNINL